MSIRLRGGICFIALVAALAGCSNSSPATTDSNSGGSPGGTETIQGIETPSSVSVVTATNTN